MALLHCLGIKKKINGPRLFSYQFPCLGISFCLYLLDTGPKNHSRERVAEWGCNIFHIHIFYRDLFNKIVEEVIEFLQNFPLKYSFPKWISSEILLKSYYLLTIKVQQLTLSQEKKNKKTKILVVDCCQKQLIVLSHKKQDVLTFSLFYSLSHCYQDTMSFTVCNPASKHLS